MRPIIAFESLISSQFSGPLLPPLWQIIYQEGIRGNHLLFSKKDVTLFETGMTQAHQFGTSRMAKDTESTALDLLKCSDLQSMIDLIESLDLEIRKNLYLMYRRVLGLWGQYLKTALN